ncbi:hypothetical protein F4782DRAFT_517197 [Xylaria castorea]|nr:hypothetical protein F4782DRAFT_517197 [Xylaria castorea]
MPTMKFTTTVFSLLALAAGVFANMDNGPFNFMPPFNTTPDLVPGKPARPNEAGEGSGNATAHGNDTVRCNRYVPFPHGPPHFAPGCSPLLIPHDGASRTSNSYAALAVGIATIVFSGVLSMGYTL